MALIVKTSNPTDFLDKIKGLMSAHIIKTWECDSDGDFTINRVQWHNRAWMHPYILDSRDGIAFGIIGSKSTRMSKELYGVYHGRFAATLLCYCDTDIIDLSITPAQDGRYDIFL